jgi:hypothetical protein
VQSGRDTIWFTFSYIVIQFLSAIFIYASFLFLLFNKKKCLTIQKKYLFNKNFTWQLLYIYVEAVMLWCLCLNYLNINDAKIFFLAWLYNVFESRWQRVPYCKLEKIIHYDNQINDTPNRYTLVAFIIESFINVLSFSCMSSYLKWTTLYIIQFYEVQCSQLIL